MPQQVVQNAAVLILLQQRSHENAQAWARHGGEFEREEWSRHFDGAGEKSWSTRWRREFYVSPDELRVLGTGEAVVWIAPVGRQKRWIGRVRIAPPRALPAVRRRAAAPLEIAFTFGDEPAAG